MFLIHFYNHVICFFFPGVKFRVNNRPFDGVLQNLQGGRNYNLEWEFDAIGPQDYLVRYNGEDFNLSDHNIQTRNGTRFDNFARQNIPNRITTVTNPNFKPTPTIIQTLYNDPLTKKNKPISK